VDIYITLKLKTLTGIKYMNDGDWVESCTALVEHCDGTWEIVTWTKEKDNVDTDTNSNTHKQSRINPEEWNLNSKIK
jgi:hypothetical protein